MSEANDADSEFWMKWKMKSWE